MPPADHGLNYVTANRFYVEIDSTLTASFTDCSGLDVQIDKEVYQEGGVNEQQRIFLKQSRFSDITLKRGITDDLAFWDWIKSALDLGKPERRNINILVFNQAGETMQAWSLLGATPVGWRTPSLQASGSMVALEELTLAYEGLKVTARAGGGRATTHVTRDSTGYFASSS